MKFASFMKLFGIIFAGLVGISGVTYGIMKATGYFEVEPIYPEGIYFADASGNATDEYLFDEDGTIVVMAQNEDCNQLNIELSLSGANVIETTDGRISDGVVILPKYAKIGEKISVQLVTSTEVIATNDLKKEDKEAGAVDWIKGGTSALTAKSTDTNLTESASCKIGVDTPVYSINLIMKDSEMSENACEGVNKGSNIYADAKFVPENSRYMYSQTNRPKEIFFTLDRDYQEAKQVGISNKFTALAFSDSIKVYGYVFTKASYQEYVIQEIATELGKVSDEVMFAEITSKINDEDFIPAGKALKGETTFSITDAEVADISFAENAQINSMTVGKSHKIYIGKYSQIYDNESMLGAILKSEKQDVVVSLQDEIGTVGLSFQVKVVDDWIDAVSNNYFDIDVADYTSSLTVDGNTYYFPVVNDKNFDASYIIVQALKESAQARVLVNFFGQDNTKAVSEDYFFNFAIVETKSDYVTWTETPNTPYEIMIVDKGNNADDFESMTFNLSDYINIPSTNQYKTVRYFAYDFKDSKGDVINANIDTYINVKSSGVAYQIPKNSGMTFTLYEIDDAQGIIRAKQKCDGITFKVLYLTIKTDKDGNLKYIDDSDTIYDYDQYSATPTWGELSSLSFVIHKTINYFDEDFSIGLRILKDIKYTQLKNGKIAKFAVADEQANALSLEIKVPVEDSKIFKREVQRGNILLLVLYNDTTPIDIISCEDFKSNIREGYHYANGIEYIVNLDINKISGGLDYDKLRVGIKYTPYQGAEEINITHSSVSIYDDIDPENPWWVYIIVPGVFWDDVYLEVYSGDAVTTKFNYNEATKDDADFINSEENPIKITTTATEGTVQTILKVGDKTEFKSDDISTILYSEQGNGVINIISEDKYGNIVEDNGLRVVSSNTDVVQVSYDYVVTYKNNGKARLDLIDRNGNVCDSLYIERTTDITISKVDIYGKESFWTSDATIENGEIKQTTTYDFNQISLTIQGKKDTTINLVGNDSDRGLIRYYYPEKDQDDNDVLVHSKLDNLLKISLKSTDGFTFKDNTYSNSKVSITYDATKDTLKEFKLKGNFAEAFVIDFVAKIPELGIAQVISVTIEPVIIFTYTSNETLGITQNNYANIYAQTDIALDYRIEVSGKNPEIFRGTQITKVDNCYKLGTNEYQIRYEQESWQLYEYNTATTEIVKSTDKTAKVFFDNDDTTLTSVEVFAIDDGSTYDIAIYAVNQNGSIGGKVDDSVCVISHNTTNQKAILTFKDLSAETKYIIKLCKNNPDQFDLSRQFYINVKPNAKLNKNWTGEYATITAEIESSKTQITKTQLRDLFSVARIRDEQYIEIAKININCEKFNTIKNEWEELAIKETAEIGSINEYASIRVEVSYNGYALNDANDFIVRILPPITVKTDNIFTEDKNEDPTILTYGEGYTKAKVVKYDGKDYIYIYNGLSYGTKYNTIELFLKAFVKECYLINGIDNDATILFSSESLLKTYFDTTTKKFVWNNKAHSVGEYFVTITDALGNILTVPVIIAPFTFEYVDYGTTTVGATPEYKSVQDRILELKGKPSLSEEEELELERLLKVIDYKFANDIGILVDNGIYAKVLNSTSEPITLSDLFKDANLKTYINGLNLNDFVITYYDSTGKQSYIPFGELENIGGVWQVKPMAIGQTGYIGILVPISGDETQFIPVLIKVESTLVFSAYYPYGTSKSSNASEIDITQDYELFDESAFDMEYITLSAKKANLDLGKYSDSQLELIPNQANNGKSRFVEYKSADASEPLESTFRFEIAEVYFKTNALQAHYNDGAKTIVNLTLDNASKSVINMYIYNDILRIDLSSIPTSDYSGVEVRVKIKVTSDHYNELYYYVCATSESRLELQQKISGAWTNNVQDMRDVVAGADASKEQANNVYRLLGKSATGTISQEYENKLCYLLTNKDVRGDSATTSAPIIKDLTTNDTSKLVIYTKYGVLKVVDLNILSNYTLKDKDKNEITASTVLEHGSGRDCDLKEKIALYQGDTRHDLTSLNFTIPDDYANLIKIKQDDNGDNTTTLQIAPFANDTQITFTNIVGKFGTTDIEYNFNLTIKFKAGVSVGKTEDGEPISDTNVLRVNNESNETQDYQDTYCAGDNLTLSEVEGSLFNIDNSASNDTYKIVYEVISGNNAGYIDGGNLWFNKISEIADVVIKATMVSFDGGDGTQEILTSYFTVKVAPVYYVTINYPRASSDQEVTCEQIQSDTTLGLGTQNAFLGQAQKRILVGSTKGTGATFADIKFVIKNATEDAFEESSLTIDSSGVITPKLASEMQQGDFDIYIYDAGYIENDESTHILYGIYRVHVTQTSPYVTNFKNLNTNIIDNTEATPETVYVDKNDENLLNQIRIKFNLPQITEDGLQLVITLGESNVQTTTAYTAPIDNNFIELYKSIEILSQTVSATTFDEIIQIEASEARATNNNVYWYLIDNDNNIKTSGTLSATDNISTRINIEYLQTKLQFENIYNFLATNPFNNMFDINSAIDEKGKGNELVDNGEALKLTAGADVGYNPYYISYKFNIDFNSEYVVCGNLGDDQYTTDTVEIEGKTYSRESITASETAYLAISKMGKFTLVDELIENKVEIALIQNRSYILIDKIQNISSFNEAKFIVYGAPNNGANVNLVVKLQNKTGKYCKYYTYLLKALPNIESYCTNGTDDINSITNPKEITFTSGSTTITIIDRNSITNGFNNFIVMKRKDSNDSVNLAYSAYKYAQTYNEFVKEVNVDGKIQLEFKKPNFGDKLIEYVLSDAYGYSVVYYFKLIQPDGVNPTYEQSTRQFYEGSLIKVGGNDSSEADIKISGIENTDYNSTDITKSISFKEYKYATQTYESNQYITSAEVTYTAGNEIQIAILDDSAFTFGNYIEGRFELELKKGDETATVYIPVRIYKRYTVSQIDEEIYVRDGEEFGIADGIKVVDNQNNSILGERALKDVYKIKIDLAINTAKVGLTNENNGSNIRKELANVFEYTQNGDNKYSVTNVKIGVEATLGNITYEQTRLASVISGKVNDVFEFGAGAITGMFSQIENPAEYSYKFFVRDESGKKIYLQSSYALAQDFGDSSYITVNGAFENKTENTTDFGGIFIENNSYIFEDQQLVISMYKNAGDVEMVFTVGETQKVQEVSGNMYLIASDQTPTLNNSGRLLELDNSNTGTPYKNIKSKAKFYYGEYGEYGVTQYVKGLNIDDEMKIRNIGLIQVAPENNTVTTQTIELNDKNGWKEADGINPGYQSNSAVYTIGLLSNKKSNATNNNSNDYSKMSVVTINYRVTTKYAGIDTSDAYGTGMAIVIADSIYNGETGYSMNFNGNIVTSGEIDVSIWAKDLKLTAGTGIANEILQNTVGANKLYVGTSSYTLQEGIKLKVIASEGEQQFVTVDGNGKLTFAEGFDITANHIRLRAYVQNKAIKSDEVSSDSEYIVEETAKGNIVYTPIGDITINLSKNVDLKSIEYQQSMVSGNHYIYATSQGEDVYSITLDELNDVVKLNGSDDILFEHIGGDVFKIKDDKGEKSFDGTNPLVVTSKSGEITILATNLSLVSSSLEFTISTTKIYSLSAYNYNGKSFDLKDYDEFYDIYGKGNRSLNSVSGDDGYSIGACTPEVADDTYGNIKVSINNDNMVAPTDVIWYKPLVVEQNLSFAEFDNIKGNKLFSEFSFDDVTVKNDTLISEEMHENITKLNDYISKIGFDSRDIKVYKDNVLLADTINDTTLPSDALFNVVKYQLYYSASNVVGSAVKTEGTDKYILLAEIVINIDGDVTNVNIQEEGLTGYTLDSEASTTGIVDYYTVINNMICFNLKSDGTSYLNTESTYTLTYKKENNEDIVIVLEYNSESNIWQKQISGEPLID